MRLRPATLADADALGRMHVETWQAAYRGIVPDERLDALSVVERAERWRSGLTVPAARRDLVADVDGRIAGFVSFGPCHGVHGLPAEEGVAEIYGLYVHPDFWRAGVGRALIDIALAEMEPAYRAVVLWTWERNARARAFYERLGFTHDGTTVTSDRFGVPLSEVRYRRGTSAPAG